MGSPSVISQSNAESFRWVCGRATQSNVTLLAELLGGNISQPVVTMDCTSRVQVTAWHAVPFTQTFKSAVVLGETAEQGAEQTGDTAQQTDDAHTDDTPPDDTPLDDTKLWSARLTSSQPSVRGLDAMTLHNQVAMKFDRRHALAVLFTSLQAATDTFSVQLPELKLAVFMNASAAPAAAANATTAAAADPRDTTLRPGQHVKSGADLHVQNLQVSSSATVTQQHVRLADDGTGDVLVTLLLEVGVRCPQLQCAPDILQFLAHDPFNWCATGRSPLSALCAAAAAADAAVRHAACRTYPGKPKDPLASQTPTSRKLLYHGDYSYPGNYDYSSPSYPWNYDSYRSNEDVVAVGELGVSLFGQLMVNSDPDYYLAARIVLGDSALGGAIIFGAQVDYGTDSLYPQYESEGSSWWDSGWGESLWNTLDRLPGLIDGLPGDRTWGWWNAFDTISTTVVRVRGPSVTHNHPLHQTPMRRAVCVGRTQLERRCVLLFCVWGSRSTAPLGPRRSVVLQQRLTHQPQ